jgi:hypothetical protein
MLSRLALYDIVPEVLYFTKGTVNTRWSYGERMHNERWMEWEGWTENELYLRNALYFLIQ